MWRIAAILAAIAAFVYVAVVGVQWLQPRVEDDILNRVSSALAEQGLLWADVTVDGRQVVVHGTAPDDATRDQALTVASRVFGVAGVSDATVVSGSVVSGTAVISGTVPVSGTVAVAQPYQLTIEKNGENLTVRGEVASEQDADVIRRIVKTHYEGAKVEDALEVAPHAPAGWRSAVGIVLMNMTNLEKAQVTLSGTEVMMEGEVLDQKYSDKMQSAIKSTLPKGYKVAFAVDVVTPTALAQENAETSVTSVVSETQADAAALDKMVAQTIDKAVSKTEVAAADASAKAKAVAAKMPVSSTAVVSNSSVSMAEVSTPSEKAEKAPAQAPAKVETKAAEVVPAAGAAAGTATEAAAATPENCAGMAKVTKAVVHFGFDKAGIDGKYRPLMKQVADTLKSCPGQHVTVAGFTDKTGSPLYNQWLSEQRAESGVRALRRDGVDGNQLTAKGYGETGKLAPNSSKVNRAKNRRIEFHPDRAAVVGTEGVGGEAGVSDTAAVPGAQGSGFWSGLFGMGKPHAANGVAYTVTTVSSSVVSGTAE